MRSRGDGESRVRPGRRACSLNGHAWSYQCPAALKVGLRHGLSAWRNRLVRLIVKHAPSADCFDAFAVLAHARSANPQSAESRSRARLARRHLLIGHSVLVSTAAGRGPVLLALGRGADKDQPIQRWEVLPRTQSRSRSSVAELRRSRRRPDRHRWKGRARRPACVAMRKSAYPSGRRVT